MTTILDFIKITRVKGVASYCLVSTDGRRMAGNAAYTKEFYSDLARIAQESARTADDTPLPPPACFSVRGPSASLLVIPVGGYTLGITTTPDTPENQLIEDVQAFLHRIRHQHTVSQKS
jgi:hypothetical protein